MKAIVIIPAFNEALVLGSVLEGILKQPDLAVDVLVVDDGSNDETFAIARRMGVKALKHKINRGQGAAIRTGLDFALARGYETAVFFDADGQMDPAEIKLFLNKIAEGYEVVLGSRNLGQAVGMPIIKRIIKQAALLFTNLTTGLKLSDTHNGFQAWTMEALKQIQLNQDRMAYASQVINEVARLRLKYIEIPVTIKYSDYSKQKGQSIFNVFGILWDLLIK